jgi:hypothetical protein
LGATQKIKFWLIGETTKYYYFLQVPPIDWVRRYLMIRLT